jgi:hypothetical protein
LNVDKEVSRLDHVDEVNKNISNLDDSINLNLWALIEVILPWNDAVINPEKFARD